MTYRRRTTVPATIPLHYIVGTQTRDSNGNGPFDFVYTCPIDGYSATVLYGTIADEIHARIAAGHKYEGRYPSGECFHIRANLFGLNTRMLDFDIVNGTRVSFDSSFVWPAIPSNIGTVYNLVGYPPSVEAHFALRLPQNLEDALQQEAFNYFSTVMPEHLSFSEFVQGFLEIQALLPEFQATILKTISAGYLNYKFGWENLISDLGALGSLLDDVWKRIEYFRRTYGRPQRMGFSRTIKVNRVPLSTFSAYPIYDGSPPFQTKLSVLDWKCRFRATAVITQTLSDLYELGGFMRVMLGTLGLDNPVKSVWKIIPFSFLVDWFANISGLLDTLTTIRPAAGWDMQNVTTSCTYNWTMRLEVINAYASSPLAYADIPVRAYQRKVGLSYDWHLLDPATLSNGQLSLIAALLHQFV